MTKRRSFIKNLALATAASGLPLSFHSLAKAKKLNLLILGGTGFLGPHTVNAALALGHNITLFNRGKTNPKLFKHLETIHGDRNTQDIKKLAGRKWDAVIDTSAYYPRSVDMAMHVLKQNIKQYLLISTISVYADWSKKNMDEKSPIGNLDDPSIEKITNETYGPLKALCEQAAEKHMPDQVTLIRPGLIVGPRDKTDRFTYWPARIKQGGEFIAPGNGKDYIQFIDVRDLAEWMIHCLSHNVTGTFNAQSKAADITIKQLIDTCVNTVNPDAKPVWITADFLEQQQVTPWQEMPVWFPSNGDFAGAGTMSSQKAYANGLKQRPLETIIKDCYQWFKTLPEERQKNLRAGIRREKESKVLYAWKKHYS